jgi:glycosyltransferase involved in cell wall biosynthesis
MSEPTDGGRPTVAFVTYGAVDRFAVPQIAAHLLRGANKEVDFVVISHTLADDLRQDVRWERIPLPSWLPFRLRYPIFFVLAALRVRRVRADLVHAFGAHPIVPSRVDLATLQFSHAAYRSVAPGEGSHLMKAVAALVERWCYRPGRVRLLAAPSRGAKRELEQHYPGIDVVVIPNGVDVNRFAPDPEGRARLRAAEGVRSDEVIALFVGRFWHGKGLDIAIEAIAAARASGVGGLGLWVVGDGAAAEESRRLAERLGVGDHVRFYGRRPDVERFLQACDVFLFPSLTETFGLACFEAAAAGVPVVATAVNGVDELLEDGRAGFLVDRTPAAFAEAVTHLATDPALRERMGVAARERALHFTWEHATGSLLATYQRLLDSSIAPRRAA